MRHRSHFEAGGIVFYLNDQRCSCVIEFASAISQAAPLISSGLVSKALAAWAGSAGVGFSRALRAQHGVAPRSAHGSATLHLPFLRGAELNPNGMLEEDAANAEVTVTLPKIKLSFE